MTIRAFYSSPYMSYAGTPREAIEQACLGLMRIRHAFRPVWSYCDLARQDRDVAWSPLIQGDIVRAEMQDCGGWSEDEAFEWCLAVLKSGIVNTLIVGDTIPRRPDATKSRCDVEMGVALDLGMRIISATDIEMGTWDG